MEINGVHYHVERSGTGQSLVLLHGFTGSCRNWDSHLAAFSPSQDVIRIDLLGHGGTDSPARAERYAITEAAADTIEILDQLDLQHVNLLGYSMGGRLALYLAHCYPKRVRLLVLEGASPGLREGDAQRLRQDSDAALANWIEQNGIEAFVQRWEALPLWDSQQSLPTAVRERLRRQRLQNDPTGLANSLRGMGTGSQPSLWEDLSTIQMPTLLLSGEHDQKFTQINQQMAAAMPHATHRIIESAGHTIHLEQPALFQEAVLHFLQRH